MKNNPECFFYLFKFVFSGGKLLLFPSLFVRKVEENRNQN